MGRPLRFIPDSAKLWTNHCDEPTAVVVGTVRCIQGRHLLRPEHRLNGLILGVIGRAQSLFAFELYAYQFSSNHFDLMVGVHNAVHAAEIFRFINTNISKEVGREEHADWRGPMFERRMRQILVLTDADLEDRFRYILSHGVKEGLVERPTDWPGVHCAKPLCEGRNERGIWIDRTELWRLRKTADDKKQKPHRRANAATVTTPYPVLMSPLPCWRDLSPQAYRTKVKALCREITDEYAELRELLGHDVLGANKVLAMSPHHKPDVVERSPAPLVYCKDPTLFEWFREQYAEFKAAYSKAQEVWMTHRHDSAYLGCFPSAGIPPGRYVEAPG